MAGETIEILRGETLIACERIGDERIDFTLADGRRFSLLHQQNCCEGVFIEDIEGDLDDLVGLPLTMAEETSQVDPDAEESGTWTPLVPPGLVVLAARLGRHPRSVGGTVPGVIHDVGRGARTSPLPAGAGEDIPGRRSPVPKARRRSGMSTESDAELVAGVLAERPGYALRLPWRSAG